MIDGGKVGDIPWLAMEHCESDLSEYIRFGKSDKVIKILFSQILDALQGLHTVMELAHLDVKSENILIKNGNAKLADFGSSKPITENGFHHWTGTFVSPEMLLCTPYYKLPSLSFVLIMRRRYTEASDIFSLGCMLYEMIAGVNNPLSPIFPDNDLDEEWQSVADEIDVYIEKDFKEHERERYRRRVRKVAGAYVRMKKYFKNKHFLFQGVESIPIKVKELIWALTGVEDVGMWRRGGFSKEEYPDIHPRISIAEAKVLLRDLDVNINPGLHAVGMIHLRL